MRTKQLDATVKALTGSDPVGSFEALVAVFGNVDSYGDVIVPGAFADDLAQKAAAGKSIPVIWSHRWDDPFSHVGVVVEAAETAAGLVVKGQLDLDNPTAVQVHKLLISGRIGQFSFAYDVLDGGWGEREDEMVYELRRLAVHEVGPCLLGVNRETELIAAKADALATAAAAGRDITTHGWDEIKSSVAILGELLADHETHRPAPAAAVKNDHESDRPASTPADPQGSTELPASAPSASRRAKARATLARLKGSPA